MLKQSYISHDIINMTVSLLLNNFSTKNVLGGYVFGFEIGKLFQRHKSYAVSSGWQIKTFCGCNRKSLCKYEIDETKLIFR